MKRDILYEEAFLKELSQSFMEDYIVDIQFSNAQEPEILHLSIP